MFSSGKATGGRFLTSAAAAGAFLEDGETSQESHWIPICKTLTEPIYMDTFGPGMSESYLFKETKSFTCSNLCFTKCLVKRVASAAACSHMCFPWTQTWPLWPTFTMLSFLPQFSWCFHCGIQSCNRYLEAIGSWHPARFRISLLGPSELEKPLQSMGYKLKFTLNALDHRCPFALSAMVEMFCHLCWPIW